MPEQTTSSATPRTVEFGGAMPILRVANLDASLAYYVDRLGFTVDWRTAVLASINRGRASMMLARGAIIRHPPTNYPWGAREVQVFDPDGHVLRFGSDLRAEEPMGKWLDEKGVRWTPQPDGSWRSA